MNSYGIPKLWLLLLAFLVGTAARVAAEPPYRRTSSEPRPGLAVRGVVVDVVDGDTLTFEIRTLVRVRLLDCWAPELHTINKEEKVLGALARDSLANFAVNRPGTLYVPFGARFDSVLSFGRALGYVWVDGKDLSELQVQKGHATRTKNGKTENF